MSRVWYGTVWWINDAKIKFGYQYLFPVLSELYKQTHHWLNIYLDISWINKWLELCAWTSVNPCRNKGLPFNRFHFSLEKNSSFPFFLKSCEKWLILCINYLYFTHNGKMKNSTIIFIHSTCTEFQMMLNKFIKIIYPMKQYNNDGINLDYSDTAMLHRWFTYKVWYGFNVINI